MYASPCRDHSKCVLDLERLRADLKALEEKMAEPIEPLLEKLEAAREAMKTGPSDPTLRAALDRAALDVREFRAAHSKEHATLLYAIRAHHRGRVHRRFERLPGGQVRELGLEEQARAIRDGRGTVAEYFRPTPE